MHRLLKLTQFCVSFIALWSQNGRFQTPQSCQFLNRSLFRSSPMFPNLGNDRNDRKNIISRVHGVTLRDKVSSCEIRSVLNVKPLLRIERSQICCVRHEYRMPHERLARQVQLGTPTGKRPRGHPRPRWSDYVSDLAWSRLGCEPSKTVWNCCWPWGIPSPSRAAPPWPSLEKRRAWKLMKWITFTLFSLFNGV